MATNGKVAEQVLTISPPDFRTLVLEIKGESPLVIARFSEKSMLQMRTNQEAGSTAKSSKKRAAKDFEADYEAAKHVSAEGWCGIHAAAFRNGAIDACRATGYVMTKAKMALFIEADGFDRQDASPLVRITRGEPEMYVSVTRNQTGVPDLRARPMWREWGALLRVTYDADMFRAQDVVNLMARVGRQIGVGEGRPFSKNSAGMGFGTFSIVN